MKLLFIFGVGLQLISYQKVGNALQMYFESQNTKTWDEAYDDCLAMGMELAILNSQADFNAAINYIKSFTGAGHIWIGYKMKNITNRIFGWINGEIGNFTPWGSSEPNYYASDSCVHLTDWSPYGFADSSCSYTLHYLCTEGSVPTVHTTQKNIHASIMATVTLECSYTSLWSVTKIFWQKKIANDTVILYQSNNDTSYSGITVTNSLLVINNMKLEHEGTYRCFVGNGFGLGEGTDIELYIQPGYSGSGSVDPSRYGSVDLELSNNQQEGPPVLQPTTTVYNINESDSVTFICKTEAYPEVILIDWAKDLGNIVTLLNAPPLSSNFSIENARVDDSGIYICKVSNVEGAVRELFTLHVIEVGFVPTVYTVHTTISAVISSKLLLECSYTSPWNIIGVLWEKTTLNETVIIEHTHNTNINISFTEHESSLAINTLKTEDEGQYRCLVQNKFGFGTGNEIQLHIQEEQDTCPCSCDYKERLDYWSSQNATNYTFEELKEILAPVTEQIRKDLLVDKKILSSAVNKLVSKSDDRSSSKGIGYIGITFLSVVLLMVVLADLTSLMANV